MKQTSKSHILEQHDVSKKKSLVIGLRCILNKTDKRSDERYSIKKVVCKSFAIFAGKHLATLLKRDCNTDVFL